MLLGQPNPPTHTGFGCPSGALVPQISPLQPVQPIPPIRPRRRGSAVTHRRAGGRGAGMRSLPHRAHLPGTTGAQPGRASGGCFLSPRGQRAPTSPSQPSRQPPRRTAPHPQLASPGAAGITRLSPNHWHPYTDACTHAYTYTNQKRGLRSQEATQTHTGAFPHQQACKWIEITPPPC